jgi:hypothetical protein
MDARPPDGQAGDARSIERNLAPVDLASTRPVPAIDPESRQASVNGVHPVPVGAGPVAGSLLAPVEPVPPIAPAGAGPSGPEGMRTTCTTAQLRRFIKSRPWVPMHELRRRFGIWGADDDVTPIRVGGQTLFIGLPEAEARMVAELLSGGDVGYELSLDPGAPIVVGVYPMRPVPRS